MVAQFLEFGKGILIVLVVHHAEHDAQVLTRSFRELTNHILDTCHIMTGITDKCRVLTQGLPAATETGELCHMGEAVLDGFGGQQGSVEGLLLQLGEGTMHRAQIGSLIHAFQLTIKQWPLLLIGKAEGG